MVWPEARLLTPPPCLPACPPARSAPPPSQVRLASVRRSLFSSETERSNFLSRLVNGTRDLLRQQSGLAHHGAWRGVGGGRAVLWGGLRATRSLPAPAAPSNRVRATALPSLSSLTRSKLPRVLPPAGPAQGQLPAERAGGAGVLQGVDPGALSSVFGLLLNSRLGPSAAAAVETGRRGLAGFVVACSLQLVTSAPALFASPLCCSWSPTSPSPRSTRGSGPAAPCTTCSGSGERHAVHAVHAAVMLHMLSSCCAC